MQLLRTAGLRDGIVTVFSRHTTAAVRTQENEPLLLEDLHAFFERLVELDGPRPGREVLIQTLGTTAEDGWLER